MIAALTLIMALLVPVAPAQDACADVFVLAARGSGQSGFGEQVESVLDDLVPTLQSRGESVRVASLDYPAISVSDSFGLVLLTGAYDRSVDDGVTELRDQLEAVSASCPLTDIVLVGYSQGAQVLKRALDTVQPVHRISSVVLLADPTRSPSSAVTRLGDPTAERPGAFGVAEVPRRWEPVTIDVCAAGDAICERGRDDLRAHVDGYEPLAAQVVNSVVAELSESGWRYLTPR